MRLRWWSKDRGLRLYGDLTDLEGHRVVVIDSSLATAIACRVSLPEPKYQTAGPHLTVVQAKRLRKALDAFIQANGGDGKERRER